MDTSASSSSEPCGTPSIKSGRPRASLVWEHFVYDVTKEKSICQVITESTDADVRFCGVEVAGKYPTNLKAHLKAVHPVQYDELMQKEAVSKSNRNRYVKLLTCHA